ncbi:hypothetical protein NSK_001570 [Nannochloropsis salina CCMP1776]|uniref:Uncharacterized protein n=1 Tax=Nannochloropsis salina CCMP1776 TaxID=1027361 RepID=A0A4D9DEU4_9STRA|nr:hypothetical protein NSK_001570 [Nannochloropsis salina CCMP1776]|eukprot:TFJ87238.1 hypothetical protein NSK_001570 [Nannochloropsis salina CCMP1776]
MPAPRKVGLRRLRGLVKSCSTSFRGGVQPSLISWRTAILFVNRAADHIDYSHASIVHRSIRSGWAKTAADASIDVIVNAVTRPEIDEPTVKVAEPRRGIIKADQAGELEEDLALDLQRKPRLDLLAGWAGAARGVDPFKSLLGSDHPVLEACAKYFFELDGGKKIRPTMVLLISRAVAAHAPAQGVNGSRAFTSTSESPTPLPSQKRLAEITEMIHTASLFHDDVIDEADERRGVPSINKIYGNKMAILAGDFLLARASVSLARLRNIEVVELLSTVIEHLVKGEVMQSRPQALLDGSGTGENGQAALEYYLHKNFYKTGSLMANSCRAAVLLAGGGDALQYQAFAYGRHVGLAFQLVDDVLDFEQTSETLGKPALNDLRHGLATAPVLLAARTFPDEVGDMVKRKFASEGDVERALDLVQRSDGLKKAKDLALVQAEQAMEAALTMNPSPARDGLIKLASLVVNRTS